MILVDTSVWIEHLRRGTPGLARALEEGRVLLHPFVLGELACGALRNREELLRLFGDIPAAPTATDSEVLVFIENHVLMGWGIGYVDMHLLASTVLEGATRLWTRDRRLAGVAASLGIAFAEKARAP